MRHFAVAGGVGLNLTAADVVVNFDPSWNPAQDLQSQDRAFRIGQTKDVKVYRLFTLYTIEHQMYVRQMYKVQLSNATLNGISEKRYFNGIQGSREEQGEIFGIKNLLIFEDTVSSDNERRQALTQDYDLVERELDTEALQIMSSNEADIERKLFQELSVSIQPEPVADEDRILLQVDNETSEKQEYSGCLLSEEHLNNIDNNLLRNRSELYPPSKESSHLREISKRKRQSDLHPVPIRSLKTAFEDVINDGKLELTTSKAPCNLESKYDETSKSRDTAFAILHGNAEVVLKGFRGLGAGTQETQAPSVPSVDFNEKMDHKEKEHNGMQVKKNESKNLVSKRCGNAPQRRKRTDRPRLPE